jgi:hypothetical protein
MKYFLDTEFIEGFHKPLFGKKRHFIDLISIGIVSEDNRSLYFISNEYDYNIADEWVKQNVIKPMYLDVVHGDARNRYSVNNFHKSFGSSNEEIAKEIAIFCGCYEDQLFWRTNNNPTFYGYFSDYDWVLFCSLFGRMIDLPKGFPMYCKDLKQILDECAKRNKNKIFATQKNHRSATLEESLNNIKTHPGYPKQHKEHNALTDAAWNKELYKFLQTL